MNPKIYAWNGSKNLPGITPFVWLNIEGNPPKDQAQLVFQEFQKRAAGDRVIFIANALCAIDNSNEAIPRQIVNGYHFDQTPYEIFFWELHKLGGPRIDRIVLDSENGVSCWGNIANLSDDDRAAYMKTLYNDPLVLAKMDVRLKLLTPDDYRWGPKWHEAMEAWNFWIDPKLIAARRTALINPCQNALGYTPKISNYGDFHSAHFPVFDLNYWAIQVPLSMGTESAPAMYFWKSGQRYTNLQKQAYWNQFIDCMNYARTSVETCVPWIPFPHYGGDNIPPIDPWLWTEMMQHFNELGLREYIYWNPDTAQDELASKVFMDLRTRSTRLVLPEVPMDSEGVLTGSKKTVYADFLARYPIN